MSNFTEFKQAAQAQLAAMPRSYRSLTAAQINAVATLLAQPGSFSRDLPVRTVRTLTTVANRPIRLQDGSTVTIKAHPHGGWYAA